MNPLRPLSSPTRPLRTLANTFHRLKNEKRLTVGYFGGSITEGAGASGPATNWRARTTALLRERYPDAEITEVNAAIGGTGSDLGAFRCQENLLSGNPDLVFVEFAVNDLGGTDELTPRAMEGIVRQIWKANPAADILFVYTGHQCMEEQYAQGEYPNSILRHHRVAAHYGIPEVNVGYELYRQVVESHGGDWKVLLPDNVHPNDAGYALYAEEMAKFLTDQEAAGGEARTEELPEKLTVAPLEKGRLLDTWSLPATTGWVQEDESLSGRYPHRLTARGPEAGELRICFHGNAIGLYFLTAPDSGILEWKLDGGEWRARNTWDTWALRFTRANYAILESELPPGEHELWLRVSAEKDEQSTGYTICIGAVLVNESY